MIISINKPALGSSVASFLAKPQRMLIDGKWVAAQSGQTFIVEDPATEETIAHVPAAEQADIDIAVAAARRALESGPWAHTLPGERSRLIWRIADLIEQNADELAELEALDNGKPLKNAHRDDIGATIAIFRYMAG